MSVGSTENAPLRDPGLAVMGGEPVRRAPMPTRFAIGDDEIRRVNEVFAYYRDRDADPGYQGHFEKLYCEAFVRYMGGGHADSVATGTAALFVAVAALELPANSEIIVSAITDPGSISAIILNGFTPRLADTARGSYNMGPEQFVDRITPETRAVMVVHAAGQAAHIDEIAVEARRRDIRVIEDCSQAHGARLNAKLVGTFGDIAAVSTMYRKAHATGASGGLVYSTDRDLYRNAMAHADRGKPRWRDDFDDRDPTNYLFPALNLHTDEISCAIGLASLARLPETIRMRLDYVKGLDHLQEISGLCRPYGWTGGDSPFFYPILVDTAQLPCAKKDFAEAILAEGIGLNPHYNYVVAEWPWVIPYLSDDFPCPNAQDIRDRSFNLYVNEKYGEAEIEDTLTAILKVEAILNLLSPGPN